MQDHGQINKTKDKRRAKQVVIIVMNLVLDLCLMPWILFWFAWHMLMAPSPAAGLHYAISRGALLPWYTWLSIIVFTLSMDFIIVLMVKMLLV